MSTEKYPYIKANVSAQFEFESIGPNGAIKKVVTYEMMSTLVKGKNEHLTGQQESILPAPRKSPFFIKQLEKAKEFMKNNPVPIELLKTK